MAFTWKEHDGVRLRVSGLLERSGAVGHGFSTRPGGVSGGAFDALNLGFWRGDADKNVAENWRRFCAAAGADPARLVRVRQVHGDRIYAAGAKDAGTVRPGAAEADGVVTDVHGLALVVLTADCLPVLLCDPVRGVAAAVHSGWRGTAQRICARAAERMIADYGCRAEDLLAAVGPGIGACCFETDGDVPAAMRAAFGAEAGPYLHEKPGGKYDVDLKALAAHTLVRAGLDPEHVEICPDCTACQSGLYWSHRRMGAHRGSMASLIVLK